jgi:catechol 2,3-dioxygenase-like lactoylglutathione lyase family enzyme
MKRLHVHVSVKDLAASIRFYQTLFAAEPAVTKPDYAKWMLADPRINFAISTHRQPVGVNHLGFQVDSDEELRGMRAQLEAADARMVEESEQTCCYAKSDKYLDHRPDRNRMGNLPHLRRHTGLRRGHASL